MSGFLKLRHLLQIGGKKRKEKKKGASKITSVSTTCPFSRWERLGARVCVSSLCPRWRAARSVTHCSANSDDVGIKTAAGGGKGNVLSFALTFLVICWNWVGVESVILGKKCDANQPAAATPSLQGCADRGCWQGHTSKDTDTYFLALKVASELMFRQCWQTLSVTHSRHFGYSVLIATAKPMWGLYICLQEMQLEIF